MKITRHVMFMKPCDTALIREKNNIVNYLENDLMFIIFYNGNLYIPPGVICKESLF